MIRVQIQSDAQESALDIIRSAITAEASRLELGLKTTERHIRAFEERYHVTSETFLRDFASEDLADGVEQVDLGIAHRQLIPEPAGFGLSGEQNGDQRGRQGAARGSDRCGGLVPDLEPEPVVLRNGNKPSG